MALDLTTDIGLTGFGNYSTFACELPIDIVGNNIFSGNDKIQNISIPNARDIASNAFKNCTSLQKLILPGLNYTNKSIFGTDSDKQHLSNLYSIDIKDSLIGQPVQIGTTFANLLNLSELKLPDSVLNIPANAFYNTSLTKLKFKDNVILQKNSLSGLKWLTSLEFTFPQTEESLGLESIQQEFNVIANITSNNANINCTFAKSKVKYVDFKYNNNCTIASMSQSAFIDCQSLIEIDLGTTKIKEIPNSAFYNCTALEHVYTPDTLTCLHENSFYGCDKLNESGFDLTNISNISKIGDFQPFKVRNIGDRHFTYIGQSAFKNFQLVDADGNDSEANLNISVDYIGKNAFESSNINSIQQLSIAQSQNYIPESCFKNSTLNTIQLKGTISIIDESAFENCNNLTNISFNKLDSLNSIEKLAFSNCSFSEFTFGKSLTSIGESAFNNCYNLTGIVFNTNKLNGDSVALTINRTAFSNCNALTSIEFKQYNMQDFGNGYEPDDWFDANSVNDAYSKFIKFVFGENSTRTDVVFTFNGGKILEYNGIKIDYECFKYSDANKTQLTGISNSGDIASFIQYRSIPNQITSIANTAFSNISNNENLSSLNINHVRQIGNGTFKGMAQLTSIAMNSVTSISQYMLSGCTNLKEISAQSAQSIQASALVSCINLTTIHTSQALTSIGDAAFYANTSIRTVPNMKDATSIGESAFCSCENLVSAELPNIVAFKSNLFNSCTSLTALHLWYNNLSIQTNALANCSQNLSVFFDYTPISDILRKYHIENAISCTKDKFGNPTNGTQMFAKDNDCTHPLLVTLDGNIYIVKNKSFVVDKYLNLLSVDPKYEWSETITSTDLSNIASIRSTAFKDTSRTQIIYFNDFADANSNKIENNTFSNSNAGSIKQLHFASTLPEQYEWNAFYSNKMGSNSNIRAIFNNGYAQGDVIYHDNDPFQYVTIDQHDIIVGVYDDKMKNNADLSDGIIEKIPSHYYAISTDAFTDTFNAIEIQNFGSTLSIMDYAFRFNRNIRAINVSNNTNSLCIDTHAFADSNISSISVDVSEINDTHDISNYGMNDNIALKYIYYSDKVSRIAPSAMVNSRACLASVDFSESLTYIGDAAFAEFDDVFPRIEHVNFNACTNLQNIGNYAFYNSILSLPNQTLIFANELTSIGDAAFAYSRYAWTHQVSGLGDIDNFTAPSLQRIGLSAFMYNRLRNVVFPTSLTYIGDYAFAYPKYRFPIHIRSNIQSIGENAFKGNIILNPQAISKNIVSIDVGLDKMKSIFGVEISPDFTAPNKAGFSDATIISATANGANPYNSFAYILSNEMHFCPQNLSIDLINRALIKIDENSITSFIPEYLTCIGPSAFYNCTKLTSIVANESLSIGPSAFYNCTSLERIFTSNTDTTSLFSISGAVNDMIFYNCKKIDNIQLLSTVPYIGASAFCNCDAIKSLYSDSTLEQKQWWILSSIGDYAFANCNNLSVFDIPQSISAIGNHVFDNCPQLKNINIDIDSHEFAKMLGYTQPSSMVIDYFGSINDDASTRINFLDVTYMNDGYYKIDNEFINKENYYDDGKLRIAISSLNYDAFDGAAQKYLNLSAISKVKPFVFSGITKLRTINFLPSLDPNNWYELEEIEDYAFNGCTGLISINGGSLRCKKIGSYAFSNCNKLLKLQVSYDALSENCIGQGAFYGTSLNRLEIVDCDTSKNIAYIESIVKSAIQYTSTNKNPLELPEYCLIVFLDKSRNIIGKYDNMFNDLMHASIDINRNAMTFVDKTKDSIKPLLLVKPINGNLPAIAANTFHANIIGRWK